MILPTPCLARTCTLFPYTTLVRSYDLAVACFHALEPFQAKEAAEKPGRAGQQDAARGFRRRIERNRFERFSVQKRGDIEVPGMKPGSVLAVDLFIFDHAFLEIGSAHV